MTIEATPIESVSIYDCHGFSQFHLILLRHNIFRLYLAGCAPQQGHRGKFFMIALIKRTRRVAIEFAI